MKKLICHFNDPDFIKNIDIDLGKFKYWYAIKNYIADRLHICEDQFYIDHPPDLKSFLYSNKHEIKLIIVKREKDILFYVHPKKSIFIKDCYRKTFQEVINYFEQKNIYYSLLCMKNNLHVKINGKEISRDKYPFFACQSKLADVQISGNIIKLNYCEKQFIFSENENALDAEILIKKAFHNIPLVSILNSRNNNVFGHLKMDEKYIIKMDNYVAFYSIDILMSYHTILKISYTSTVLEVKSELAAVYRKIGSQLNPEIITLYDSKKQKIKNNDEMLANIQSFTEIFYFDLNYKNMHSDMPNKMHMSKRRRTIQKKHSENHSKYSRTKKDKQQNVDQNNHNSDLSILPKNDQKSLINFELKEQEKRDKNLFNRKTQAYQEYNHDDFQSKDSIKNKDKGKKDHLSPRQVKPENNDDRLRHDHKNFPETPRKDREQKDKQPAHFPSQDAKDKKDQKISPEKKQTLEKEKPNTNQANVLKSAFIIEKSGDTKYYPVRKSIPIDWTVKDMKELVKQRKQITKEITIKYQNKNKNKIVIPEGISLRDILNDICEDDKIDDYTCFYVEFVDSQNQPPQKVQEKKDDLIRRPRNTDRDEKPPKLDKEKDRNDLRRNAKRVDENEKETKDPSKNKSPINPTITYVHQHSGSSSSKHISDASKDTKEDFFNFIYRGEPKKLKFRNSSLLRDNTAIIKKAFGIHPDDQIEFFLVIESGDDEIIEEGNEKMEELKSETIKVCEKVTKGPKKISYYFQTNRDSRTCKVDLSPDATVRTLKKIIADMNHIDDLSNIKVLYAGKDLLNDMVLEQLEIGDTKIFVYIRSEEDIMLMTAKALLVNDDSYEYYYEEEEDGEN